MNTLVNLASLLQNRMHASVDLSALGAPGQSIEVDYYPARLTAQMVIDITDMQRLESLTEERTLALMTGPAQHLTTLLAAWNLSEVDPVTGEERPMPLDAEHIAQMGVMVQWAILNNLTNGQTKAAAGEAPASEA